MTDDYKKGLITGLAMQPLYVTTGADIVKYGEHNLLTDSAVTFGSDYTSFQVDGERVMCNVSADPSQTWWFKAIAGLKLRPNFMYKITASRFNGYGRFGISNILGQHPFNNVGRNAYGTFVYDPTVPSDGDNHILQHSHLVSQFYIGQNSTSYTTAYVNAEIWFCTDLPYNDAYAAHSFDIALYEQLKETIDTEGVSNQDNTA